MCNKDNDIHVVVFSVSHHPDFACPRNNPEYAKVGVVVITYVVWLYHLLMNFIMR